MFSSYHDSKSKGEARDCSLPGVGKLIVILKDVSTKTFPILDPLTSLMNFASRVSRFGRHSPKKNPIWSPLGFLQFRKSPKERSLSTGWPTLNCWIFSMPSSTKDLKSPTLWGRTSKPPTSHLRKTFLLCFFLYCISHLSEKRDTRIMRDAAMVMTAQRTDRTLTMMVQHILGAPSFEPNSLASTPPGNLPHRAVCYDWQLRMRPSRRR